MLTFLEYRSIEEIYHFLRITYSLPVSVLWQGDTRLLQKVAPASWSELVVLGGESLFEETKIVYLVDISALPFTSDLTKLNGTRYEQVYLYNPYERTLKSGNKKLLKKARIPIRKTAALTLQEKREYARAYTEEHLPTITPSVLNQVVNLAESLAETIIILETLAHVDAAHYLPFLQKTPQPKLYLADFKPGNKNSILPWYQSGTEDEVQLLLALLHTKLLRTKPDLAAKLAAFDHRIKTNSKIKSLTWYRFFLWSAWRHPTPSQF